MNYFMNLFTFVFIISLHRICKANEMTFELPDNEKQCFHEIIDKDVKCTLEYQVLKYRSLYRIVFKFDYLPDPIYKYKYQY